MYIFRIFFCKYIQSKTSLILRMIINTILSIVFLGTCRRYLAHLRQLAVLRKKIVSTRVLPVDEALKKLSSLQGGKIFMIVRGLIKMKFKMEGQKSIYSIFKKSKLRKGTLSQYLMRRGWEQLAGEAHWKLPYQLKNLVFQLKDMVGKGVVQIRDIQQAALSGALNESLKQIVPKKQTSNILATFLSNVYNYVASSTPFSWVLSPMKIGEQLTLYSIQDGQYSLVVGEFQKDAKGTVFCRSPNYITKQISYVNSRLRKRYNRLCLITALLIILLSITGIKVIRILHEQFVYWRSKHEVVVNEEEQRSEDEGDNCNCALCYVNVRNVIFKPCRHFAVCKSCYTQLPLRSTCPFCKNPIDGIIEVIKKK